jgi:hypothetical protein
MNKTLFTTILSFLFLLGCQEQEKNISIEEGESSKNESIQTESEDYFGNLEGEKELLKKWEEDPKGFETNYNLGILYYNTAVNMIINPDSVKLNKILDDPYVHDLPLKLLEDKINSYEDNINKNEDIKIEDIDSKTYALINSALQYLTIAYSVDSSSETVLYGLTGCYFTFGDMQNFNKYNSKLVELRKKTDSK